MRKRTLQRLTASNPRKHAVLWHYDHPRVVATRQNWSAVVGWFHGWHSTFGCRCQLVWHRMELGLHRLRFRRQSNIARPWPARCNCTANDRAHPWLPGTHRHGRVAQLAHQFHACCHQCIVRQRRYGLHLSHAPPQHSSHNHNPRHHLRCTQSIALMAIHHGLERASVSCCPHACHGCFPFHAAPCKIRTACPALQRSLFHALRWPSFCSTHCSHRCSRRQQNTRLAQGFSGQRRSTHSFLRPHVLVAHA